ncbi:MAG: type II toxin-antitoxin system VapC family toxin [Bryobacteraceae bacterium]|nr:type II toxin-antitoxin system VapC family toxin [Bryobacteraceae bacterium]
MAVLYVLDASALLAVLFDEPGGALTGAALEHAAISAVNYTEVAVKLMRMGASLPETIDSLNDLRLPIIPWDGTLAQEACDLSPLAWTHGLSLGDRACLATARHLRRTALTAERNWRKLPRLGVKIKFIR